MENKKVLINKVIENLKLINDEKTPFTSIEKDIILQNLREAYSLVLAMEVEEVRGTANEEREIMNEKTVNEKIPQEETKYEIQEEEVPEEDKTPEEDETSEEDETPEEEKEEVIVYQKEEVVVMATLFEEEKVEEEKVEEEVEEEKEKIEEEKIEEEIEIKIEEEEVEEKTEEKTDHSLFQQSSIAFSNDEDDILTFIQGESEQKSSVETPQIEADDFFQLLAAEAAPKPSTPQDEQPSTPPHPASLHQSSQKRSLNDLLIESREDKSLNTKLQNTKIGDLTKSISVNDKFLFIRELFGNKGEEFSAAIQSLNNCTHIEEAVNLMETMKKQYFWDSTSPAYLTFCDLIRRKF